MLDSQHVPALKAFRPMETDTDTKNLCETSETRARSPSSPLSLSGVPPPLPPQHRNPPSPCPTPTLHLRRDKADHVAVLALPPAGPFFPLPCQQS